MRSLKTDSQENNLKHKKGAESEKGDKETTLATDQPLAEKDEVKEAEVRTQQANAEATKKGRKLKKSNKSS